MLLINKFISIIAKLCAIHILQRFSFLMYLGCQYAMYCAYLVELCCKDWTRAVFSLQVHIQLCCWSSIPEQVGTYPVYWTRQSCPNLAINKMFFTSVYRTFRKPTVARILFRMYEIFHPICSCANLQRILDFVQNVHGGLDPRFKSVISE
jgi:hypothetical protein